MMEKKWAPVPPELFTANGTTDGHITISDTTLFKVKQLVLLASNTIQPFSYQIKRINSKTDMELGIPSQNIDQRSDLSAYKVSDSAQISYPGGSRSTISWEDIRRAVYEEEPTVALRTIWVDELGNPFDEGNPIPITFDGTVSIGTVIVQGHNGNSIEPNPDGSVNVIVENQGSANPTVNTYNEVSSVAMAVLTTVVTYTVPVGKTATLERVAGSGDNLATYQVLVNGSIKDLKRTYWGEFNVMFDFTSAGAGFHLIAGDVVTMKIIHASQFLGTFDGRIQVVES